MRMHRFFLVWLLTLMAGLAVLRFLTGFLAPSHPTLAWWLFAAAGLWWTRVAFNYIVVMVRAQVLQEIEQSRLSSGESGVN